MVGWLVLSIVGILAGAVNGLLGTGGGIIITYFLSRLAARGECEKNDIFANSLVCMIPLSLVSFFMYVAKGYVAVDPSVLYLLPPAIIGGAIGSFLLKRLDFKIIRLLFVLLVIYSGFAMLF